jgi:hypothetical protein
LRSLETNTPPSRSLSKRCDASPQFRNERLAKRLRSQSPSSRTRSSSELSTHEVANIKELLHELDDCRQSKSGPPSNPGTGALIDETQ